MGWGSHPDTMSIARAQGYAMRSGHAEGSAGYLQVYRDAYAARCQPGERGLARMLAGLDARIAELRKVEAGEMPDPKAEGIERAFAGIGANRLGPEDDR